MPIVSVIVPVYNAEKYLHRCVDSILAQTFTDFELLLIDDGSKDNSGKICDEYAAKDSRVRVFHKENGGANSARNHGLDKAKSEWVTFVDSDDLISDNAFELMCSFSKKMNVDAVIANSEYNGIINGEKWIRLLLDCKIRCEVWGVLYRRELIQKLECNIPASIVIGEDFLMNLECATKSSSIVLIPDRLYNYTQGQESSLVNSFKITLEHERLLLKIMNKILCGLESNFTYEIFRKKYLTMERLLFIGEDPYSEEWVKSLMEEKEIFKDFLGFKEKFLLMVPVAFISRFVLKFGVYIKGKFKH